VDNFVSITFLAYNAIIYLCILKSVFKADLHPELALGKMVLGWLMGSLAWSQLVFLCAQVFGIPHCMSFLIIALCPITITGTVFLGLIEK
jgi:hypothetical protein